MGRLMDIVEEWERTRNKGKPNVLDGHRVERIVWETDRAVIFADEQGRFWRYLHAYAQAWPVIIEKGKE